MHFCDATLWRCSPGSFGVNVRSCGPNQNAESFVCNAAGRQKGRALYTAVVSSRSLPVSAWGHVRDGNVDEKKWGKKYTTNRSLLDRVVFVVCCLFRALEEKVIALPASASCAPFL